MFTISPTGTELADKVNSINRSHRTEFEIKANGTLLCIFHKGELISTGTPGALLMNMKIVEKALTIGKQLGHTRGWHDGIADFKQELAAQNKTV